MSAMKIKKGDTVKVIAGKDKGKEGKVLAVNSGEEIILNAENKWTYTWSELDEKKAAKCLKMCKPEWWNHHKRSSASHLQRNARCRRKSYKSRL